MVSKYEVKESVTSKGYIRINIQRPVRPVKYTTLVKPPSLLDRIRGLSFETKLVRARSKMQAKCNNMNKAIEEAEKLIPEKKFDLSNPPQGGSGLPSKMR